MRDIFSENIKIIKGYHCGIQVEGPHLTLVDPVVSLRILRFSPTARQRYAPHDVAVKNKNKI